MTVYTEVDVYAAFETEQQAENHIDNLEEKVMNFIEVNTEMDGNFSFGLDDCDLDGKVIIIKLSSSRYKNAKWQTEQVFSYLKTTNGLIEFNDVWKNTV